MKIQERLVSIFDNLVANIIVYLLIIIVPIILGAFLKLGVQTTLIVMLLAAQALTFFLLFSIFKTTSQTRKGRRLLVKNADTGQFYLVDQFSLPRPIDDDDTAQYFAEVFGYHLNEIPTVVGSSLISTGPKVNPRREWRRPRTIEDDMSAEARRSLKFLKKYPRTDGEQTVISFCIRNDSDHNLQINSAKLVFDTGAPISVGDISPKNKPIVTGLLECRLLFSGINESNLIMPQEEYEMDLFLTRKVSTVDVLTSVRLGYVRITGAYRDTQINFHLDA